MPGSPSHLVRRFFDVLFARPLTAAERQAVLDRLEAPMAALFFEQQAADQRHGYAAAGVVLALGQGEPVVVTALMHDVGKRHARLGVIGRSIASILIKLRLPLTRRMLLYREHGRLGAADLASLGAPQLAVDYARHHHGSRPASVEPAVWQTLALADQPQRPGRRHPPG